MGNRQSLEFLRDTHLPTLHPELRQPRKDLVCAYCGHFHGQIWATAKMLHLTVISMAVVRTVCYQVMVAPVCDWCGRKTSRALSYEMALAKASQLKESFRLQELRKYYPKGKRPWVRKSV